MTERDTPAPLDDEVVGWDVLDQLFEDVTLAAELLEVRVKPGAVKYAEAGALDLAAARRALTAGAGVQLRYRHAGASWCDTLLPVEGGVRVVRMQLGG